MTYAEACKFLFALPRFAVSGSAALKPGLENIRRLLAGFGNPHATYPTIHVAGTNGKGSVCSMIAAILSASGRTTGLHTSPHLFSFNERMRIDGVPAAERWVADAVTRFQAVFAACEPSFFEASTALSFLHFAEMNVDIAVVEVGLGGRLDATNILEPVLSVITSVGLDHVEQLGDTIEQIAREKAGIIKTGTPIFSGACRPVASKTIREIAHEREAPYYEVCGGSASFRAKYPDLRLGLNGEHQAENALLAARVAKFVLGDESYSEASIRTGLAETAERSGIRGRCEVLRRAPYVVVDVAHNVDSFRAAVRFAQSLGGETPLYVVLGLMADKDVDGILNVLRDVDCIVMPVDTGSERGLPPAELAARCVKKGLSNVEIAPVEEQVRRFVEHATERDRLLVAGSHFVVGRLPKAIVGPTTNK